MQALQLHGDWAAVLVIEDGRYREELSMINALPEGVIITSLAHAIERHPALVEKYLGKLATGEDDALAALNTAMIEDGAFIYLPSSVTLHQPVLVLYLAADAGENHPASHPRNLIIVEQASRAVVVEHYATLTQGIYFSNALTEVFVADRADLAHYVIEEDSPFAFCVAALHSKQGVDSRFASHTALLGGQLVRNDVHVELAGDRAWSLLNGLYIPSGTQHMDNHMRVIHAREHGDSRQFYKGVLRDQATGVFTGRIVVKEGAQKTDAKQTNRNLLLSDKARITTRPQLEIYADDVKCTHGATTGQLDQQALFYLQARGIPTDEARAMLIHAFAQESLERMELDVVREYLSQRLMGKLSG
ncbi:MAG: Fe-S cluster assembly protein SufD [Phycisphaerales bacterium]|nr:Fe-S cluster assembly protein SufD [Phycisphaerales bacterium]